MQTIKNHRAIFDTLFPTEIPENLDLSDPQNHYELEKLNPKGTTNVGFFDAIVRHPYTNWTLISHFYVCKALHEHQTYLLFRLHWDDNWGSWGRESCAALTGAQTSDESKDRLFEIFAKDNLKNAGGGAWKKFLRSKLVG